MASRLGVLNLGLGVVGCLLVAGLARELLTAQPLPPPPAPRAARPSATPSAASTATAPPSGAGYAVIAAKNLFSANRSEAPAGPVAAAAPKPVLHGVVMDGPKSRAYLEDPVAKRTFGYAVGDSVGGGRVESIAADRVVIGRGDGVVEVLLHDPSKPKPPPAATPPAPAPPTAAASAPAAPLPSTPPGGPSGTPAPPGPPSRAAGPGLTPR